MKNCICPTDNFSNLLHFIKVSSVQQLNSKHAFSRYFEQYGFFYTLHMYTKSDTGVLYQCSVLTETTGSCNVSYQRKFCGLSEYVRLKNVRLLIKSIDQSKCDSAELAYAHLKYNFKFRGCLRSLRPLKFHISLFSFKYHITMVFLTLRLSIGHFAIDLILLQKLGISHSVLWPQQRFEVSGIILYAF